MHSMTFRGSRRRAQSPMASDVLVLLLSRIFFQGCERVRLCVGHILSGEKLERVLIQVMIKMMLG